MTTLKFKGMKLAFAVSIVLTMMISWLAPPLTYAENANDPAPYILAKIVNEHAGKKVLFDNTHAQTAGAADWVIDGGFSDFGHGIAGNGFEVRELRKTTPITYADLAPYDVFVVAEPNIPYKISEQAAMLQYVQQGGSIFFIGDHYNADRNKNRWDGSEAINGYRRGAWEDPAKGMSTEERNSAAMQGVENSDWLGQNFGVRFRYNALGDINATHIVAPEQAFGITEGVSSVAMHAGSTLAIVDPSKAKGIVYLPKTNAAWPNAVDQGVYNGGGVAEGPYVAIAKVGLGKAAFIGDSSPVEDATPKYLREETGAKKKTYDGFKEADDATLLLNIVDWLADEESYTSLVDLDGLLLDQPTALLPIENPQTSVEPQPEPWSQPAAGYKWWDASTFKSGSYGASDGVVSNPAYSFVHQAILPNAAPFQIRVEVKNLASNSTLSGLSAGIYLSGGTQVAKIQNGDGTWPSSYGYSGTFSVTADNKGYAYKDITVQIKPNTTGAASLRLRQNGSNLITNNVTIANVAAEPLPETEAPHTEVPELINISSARTQAEGTVVTIEGVITTEPGIFGSQAFYMQDTTGGIYVYQNEVGFHQGDKVRITAPIALYNGEIELTTPVALEKKGTTALPAPVKTSTVNQINQGQLVQLKNVVLSKLVSATPTGSFEFDATTLDPEGITTHVRVDVRTGLSEGAFTYQEGDKLDITGIASIYRGVFQLKPRDKEDITATSVVVPPVKEPEDGGATAIPSVPVLTSDLGYKTGLRAGDFNILMNLWWGNNGSSYRLFENGGLIHEGQLKDVSPNAQQLTIPISEKLNGTYSYELELINRFGVTKSQKLVVEVTDAKPGIGVLSNNNWDRDGNYEVVMNMWWGTNADRYELYENGELVDTQKLQAATPLSQQAITKFSNKASGVYEYEAILTNAAGQSSTQKIKVEVIAVEKAA
ncbi:DUF5689 domain-containing protein [Paenibacillus turicensis]